MKTPRFSLQKILNLKELLVESHAVELEKSRQDLDQKRNQLESMQVNKNQTLANNVSNHQSGAALKPMLLQLSRDYLVELSTRIEHQEKTVTESTTRVANQHQTLIKANQEKKALEILRSKHLIEYKKALNKKEQLEESEIALRIRGPQRTDGNDS